TPSTVSAAPGWWGGTRKPGVPEAAPRVSAADARASVRAPPVGGWDAGRASPALARPAWPPEPRPTGTPMTAAGRSTFPAPLSAPSLLFLSDHTMVDPHLIESVILSQNARNAVLLPQHFELLGQQAPDGRCRRLTHLLAEPLAHVAGAETPAIRIGEQQNSTPFEGVRHRTQQGLGVRHPVENAQ